MSREGTCDKTEGGLRVVEFETWLWVWGVCGDFGKHCENNEAEDGNNGGIKNNLDDEHDEHDEHDEMTGS